MAEMLATHHAVIQGAYRRLDQLHDRVDALERASRNREEASGIALVLGTCRQMIHLAESLIRRQTAKIEQDSEGATDYLNTIRLGVESIHKAVEIDLDYLARPPLLDVEPLIRPFIRLANLLTHPMDSVVIFSSQDRDRFHVWPDSFEYAKANAHNFASGPGANLDALPTVAIVSYPSYVDSDTFQHSVIAHEVAHLVLQKPMSPGSTDRLDDLFSAELTKRGGILGVRPDLAAIDPRKPETDTKEPAPAKPEGRTDQTPEVDDEHSVEDDTEKELRDEATTRLQSWFAELACDLIAIRSFGPVFFFALVDYVMPRARTRSLLEGERFQTHPPMSWRLEQLIEEARAFIEEPALNSDSELVRAVFNTYVKAIELHAEFEPAEMNENEAALLKAAIKLVGTALPDLIEEAIYAPKTFAADLPIVLDKLRAGIAPVERVRGRFDRDGKDEAPAETEWSTAIDWRSILNGCFIFSASGESAEGLFSAKADYPTQRETDCRVARGSVELSELLRQMRDLKDQASVLPSA